MARFLLITFVIAAVIFVQCTSPSAALKCGENQKVSNCANACIGTCSRPNPGLCMINPQYCEKGCKCKEGYVFESNNSRKCIAEEECPEQPHKHKPKH